MKVYYDCIVLSYNYDNAADNPVYGMGTYNEGDKTSNDLKKSDHDENKDATGVEDYDYIRHTRAL